MHNDDHRESGFFESHVKRSKKLAILRQRALQILQEQRNMDQSDEESEEVKNYKMKCSKCRKGKRDDEDDGNSITFPHIQDLCPADKKRIAQLVKHLAKCTREMREAKSDLAVSEAEREALDERYRVYVARQEFGRQRLESQLRESEAEKSRLRTEISRALEVLTRQISRQHKQFVGLADSVSGLLSEKTKLRHDLIQRSMLANALSARIERIEESKKMEKLRRAQESSKCSAEPEMVHRSCQTDVQDQGLIFKDIVDYGNSFGSASERAKRTKSKDDLEEPTPEVTLIRDLFFRSPSIEETIGVELIPKLSKDQIQSKRPNSTPFM